MAEPEKVLTISRLPDGRFVLSTDPQRALSEAELRVALGRTISRTDIIEDLIQGAKRTS
ncbi:MAG TPA: hypothetical protein VMX16_11055 [Terriglobia bacterium]|nr:hypothetical protein [Terriglobia bacterium]